MKKIAFTDHMPIPGNFNKEEKSRMTQIYVFGNWLSLINLGNIQQKPKDRLSLGHSELHILGGNPSYGYLLEVG